MAARGGRNNIVARRVIDDLIDISGERSPPKYLKIFIEQQITDHRRFIARMRDEIRTSTNLISQLNALIAELEASGDYEEVFDLVMELRDDRRDEQDKVADFNRLIAVAEEKIHGKEIDLEMLEAEGNDAFALKISPPKNAETPVESPIPISPSSSVGSSSSFRSTTPPPDYLFDKSILDNSLWIIPQPLGSEPVPEKPNESDAC
ncbi:hypothetical protein Tco_0506658 [Tanacetum coccineum]